MYFDNYLRILKMKLLVLLGIDLWDDVTWLTEEDNKCGVKNSVLQYHIWSCEVTDNQLFLNLLVLTLRFFNYEVVQEQDWE